MFLDQVWRFELNILTNTVNDVCNFTKFIVDWKSEIPDSIKPLPATVMNTIEIELKKGENIIANNKNNDTQKTMIDYVNEISTNIGESTNT